VNKYARSVLDLWKDPEFREAVRELMDEPTRKEVRGMEVTLSNKRDLARKLMDDPEFRDAIYQIATEPSRQEIRAYVGWWQHNQVKQHESDCHCESCRYS
jgi:hypothetical protein